MSIARAGALTWSRELALLQLLPVCHVDTYCLSRARLPAVEGEFERLKAAGATVVMPPYHPGEDPDVTATRLMNAVWMGADSLLRGERWR